MIVRASVSPFPPPRGAREKAKIEKGFTRTAEKAQGSVFNHMMNYDSLL
jgi:hypothetical protein